MISFNADNPLWAMLSSVYTSHCCQCRVQENVDGDNNRSERMTETQERHPTRFIYRDPFWNHGPVWWFQNGKGQFLILLKCVL